MKNFIIFSLFIPALWSSSIFMGTTIDRSKVNEQQWPSNSIINFEISFIESSEKSSFPAKELDKIWDRESIACISWLPKEKNGKVIRHKNLLKGRYDPYIIQFAKEAKKWGKPFLLRVAPNMNGKENHWGSRKKEFGSRSPLLYKEIFRYIAGIFRQEKVSNALFVFSPSSSTSQDPPAIWKNLLNYYPGEPFVDILAMGGNISGKDFKDVFYHTYNELKKLSTTKPVIAFTEGNGGKVNYILTRWKISGIVSDEPLDVKKSSLSTQKWALKLEKRKKGP